jgi:anti-sigma factor RsiW
MNHKPFQAAMQAVLDGDLPAGERQALEAHLLTCLACQAEWVALSEVHRLFKLEPLAAPRAGFSGRFQARLAQRRSRPRLIGGAVALGLGAVGLAALVVPLGLGALLTGWRVAQQPATLLALWSGADAVWALVSTLAEALYITARAVLEPALTSPLAWGGALLALTLTVVWVYVMRRVLPQERLP